MTQQSLLPEVKASVKTGIKKKLKKHEENLQLAVCKFLKLKYPSVIFMCDLASGMRMPIFMAARNKKMRSSRGLPDLFIAQAKKQYHGYPIPLGDEDLEEHQPTHYSGLFIELKREEVRLKSGGLAKSDHLDEQLAVIEKLKNNGYQAYVCCGYDEAIAVIDNYLK